MATAYMDYSRTDDTGNGLSWANAKKTLAAASTVAGANGTVKVAGQALVALPNGTWTLNSTTVGFASDPGLAVGDYIATARADWMSFRVTAIHQGAGWDVTLAYAWRGTTSVSPETTNKIPCYGLTGQQVLSATGQTVTFGWNTGTDSQDGSITAFKRASGTFILINIVQGNTTLACGSGLLRLFAYGSGSHAISLGVAQSLPVTVTGTLGVSDEDASVGGVYFVGDCSVGRILASGGAGYALYPGGVGTYTIGEAILWNHGAFGMTAVSGSVGVINGLTLNNCTNFRGGAGRAIVGRVQMTGNHTLGGPAGYPAGIAIGMLDIVSGTPAYPGPIDVGGPVSLWRHQTTYGIVDKTTGRGGTGYCLRLTPNSVIFPLEKSEKAMAEAGQAVTLSFWCYYTGTTAPVCQVILAEPNGLSGSPTFVPEGTWAQKTVTFAGTTAQKGSLEAVLQVFQNAAADAVLYIDDITWTGAGGVADTSGMEYHGLMPLAQKVAAGGLPFPLGL